MTEQHLHIISFDIPYPPDYGGVMDIYYRIKALHECGVKVHLHCFEYGRSRSEVLNKYCFTVKYYKRNTSPLKLLSSLPYIVSSRENNILINELAKDDHPVLMEGLHTTFYLGDERLSKRKVIIRSHNIEHDYYHHLAEIENNPVKKIYFTSESGKLRKYEPVMAKAYKVAAISQSDTLYINKKYNNAFHLPPFHANEKVNSKTGIGNFALYHGNLGVGENDFAAQFLVTQVFNRTKRQLIIAGNNPTKKLLNAISHIPNVTLTINPGVDEMQKLLQEAHINILPTFQSTGIKLKLVNALFCGRFCIANKKMTDSTGLESLCRIGDTSDEMVDLIEELFEIPFTDEMIVERNSILNKQFNNSANATMLIKQFFEKKTATS